MTAEDERDYAEESYNANLCPECDYSPCIGGQGKGSCDRYDPEAVYADAEAYVTEVTTP